MEDQSPTRLWLLRRMERHCTEAVRDLIRAMAEELSMATADAANVRVLSADGRWLLPVTAYHPDPNVGAAMTAAMVEAVPEAGTGMWRQVLEERRIVEWDLIHEDIPVEATEIQQRFLQQYPVRSILAAPLLLGDRLVGGASLVRFITDRPFTEVDRLVLADFGRRVAAALEFQRVLAELSEMDPDL